MNQQWYVKSFSALTGVSVQTLHRYDRIGLLKPCARLANGYRLYSEEDLSKIQKIIVLKFFGFNVDQQKMMLENIDITSILTDQISVLEKKTKQLNDANDLLKSITRDYIKNKTIDWGAVKQSIDSALDGRRYNIIA